MYTKDKLAEILAETLEVDLIDLEKEQELEKYSWDSLAIITLMSMISDEFDVVVDGRALFECKNIDEIEDLIKKS